MNYAFFRVTGGSQSKRNGEQKNMYQEEFYGTHYEIGYSFGEQLFFKKRNLLQEVPFPVTEERIRFAEGCRPSYEKWYPEVLEEIRGIAEGQRADPKRLEAVLLGMYAIVPETRCSCLAFREGAHVILGRNSDFLTVTKEQNRNVINRLAGGFYAFQGNTTAFVEMEDGVNEHGLAVGLTSVYPVCRGYGLNAGMLLRYGLERCRTVEEFVRTLKKLPTGSSQTFTAADRTGAAAVIECNPERMEVCRLDEEHPFVFAVNTFHLDTMKSYRVESFDDWNAKKRYETIQSAFSQEWTTDAVSFAMNVLRGKYGFLCQYDRTTGKDTVWSVVYDVGEGKLWQCEGNPFREDHVEDGRFVF